MARVTVKPVYHTPVEDVAIKTEFIKLDSFLKLCNAVQSGGEAKTVIQEGQVKVLGLTCTQRGKKLRPGDTATFGGKTWRVTGAPACT